MALIENDTLEYAEGKKWAEKMKKLVPNYQKACEDGAEDLGISLGQKQIFKSCLLLKRAATPVKLKGEDA